MKTKDLPPAYRALGERLHEAAAREIAGAPATTRRLPVRRIAIVIAAVLVLVAGVAGAGQLIDVGKPVPPLKLPPRAQKHPGAHTIVVRAADPDGGPPWGVRISRSDDGGDCAMAGRIRGSTLGFIENGAFRPYADDAVGPCFSLKTHRMISDLLRPHETPRRTVLYGRAQPGVTGVTVIHDGERRTARPGPGGAFLFVFRGYLQPAEFQVSIER